MNQFNNREIAIAIWLSILIAWVITIHSVRKSLHDVLNMFTKKVILIPFVLMGIYIALLIYGLYEIGVWDHSQLKNTIIWSVAVAAVSLVNVNKIADDPHYFKKTLKDNLKLLVVLEFIINFYTFSLWVELIIIPVTIITGIMLVVSQTDKKYGPVTKLLNIFLSLIGGGLIIYSVYNLVTDFGSFATRQTLIDFSLPPLLTLLYIPFLYVMALYIDYEEVFFRLNYSIKDSSLKAYAKRRAILTFHFRTGLLKRWARNLMTSKTETRENIENSLREVMTLYARERNPLDVPYNQGWSPYHAKNFLESEGLVTDDYHRIRGDSNDWHAYSHYFKIGNGIMSNNIAYYVEGDENIAMALKLIMDINNPDESKKTTQKFLEFAKLLFEKALRNEIPYEIEDHIASETEIVTQLYDKKISLSKELWPEHRLGGYSLKFVIANTDSET